MKKKIMVSVTHAGMRLISAYHAGMRLISAYSSTNSNIVLYLEKKITLCCSAIALGIANDSMIK